MVIRREDGKGKNEMALKQEDRVKEQDAVRKAGQRARLMPPRSLEKLGQLSI